MNLKNRKVLIVGLANTGLAVARFLKDRGAQVTATDLMTQEQLGQRAQEALALGISLKLGEHKVQDFLSCSLVVLSPGVPHTIKAVEAARDAGIPVVGEVELAAQHIDEPVVAITGTNGKTTTTNLIGQMLESSGFDVFVGGNIGRPLIDYVHSGNRKDIVVAEISSFQLDTIETFKPQVGVLLNVTEDHLDRYNNFQGYIRSKGRLFINQDHTDFAVLNRADPCTKILEPKIPSNKLYFNTALNGKNGAQLKGRKLICKLPGDPVRTLDLTHFNLRGAHNLENAAAASLAALAIGASESGVIKALYSFTGLHHRLEYAKTIRGTHYYNDSKGTNVGAVVRALKSFDARIILIMGGRDKGGDYTVLNEHILKNVKQLIVIGEAKRRILNALGKLTRSQEANSLEEAVDLASQAAEPGDVVLLSPGCSSYDMFSDYAQRGEVFCRAVEGLQ